jgi:hypothetical protein
MTNIANLLTGRRYIMFVMTKSTNVLADDGPGEADMDSIIIGAVLIAGVIVVAVVILLRRSAWLSVKEWQGPPTSPRPPVRAASRQQTPR